MSETIISQKKIDRINQLYHKSKEQGLNEAEKKEQAELRAEYVAAMKNSLRSVLNNIDIKEPDGSITRLADKDKSKK
jgi:5-formyltetrahydrofolate cyclo-ligase